MKLIDVDELIKELNESFVLNKSTSKNLFLREKFLDEVIHIIEEQPNADRWILCKERLPKENENVLVYTQGDYMTICSYYKGRFCIDSVFDKVIAWQPLPTEYEE